VTCAYHPGDPARALYVLGAWRRRIDQDGLAEALAEHLLAVRPHVVGVEQAAYKQAATQALVQDLVYRTNNRLATTVRAIPSVQDKVTRARPAAAKGEAGLLYVDRGLPEVDVLIRECLALPLGEHDDLADALSGAAAMCLYGVEQLTQGQVTTGANQRLRFG
jgi:predicted phage terminase large subunit-like protein